MFQALNMELEIVRTVLVNEINDIYVCVDLKRDTSVFYTLISIKDTKTSREIVRRMGIEGLFSSNNDFIGHFNYKENLNLVFLYKRENKLTTKESTFVKSFKNRKDIATSFIMACAETEITGSVGEILIEDKNINISSDGKIYFNYFLDFSKLNLNTKPTVFFQAVANYAFSILSREYNVRYDGMVVDYPDELQVFQRKTITNGFTTFNHMITFIKMLPDKLHEKSTGIRRLFDKLRALKNYLVKNYMTVLLTVVVLTTIIYTVYQVNIRMAAQANEKEFTSYIGMETIGDVYLGETE